MSNPKTFQPEWTSEPPKPGTYRSIFKWGAPDAFKHPNKRLYAMIKDKFGMTDTDFAQKQKTGDETVKLDKAPVLTSEQVNRLTEMVGPEDIAMDDYSRVKFATGKTAEEIMKLRDGSAVDVPDLVIHPRDKHDVERIVAYCNDQVIPIYVFGAGSSVTLGVTPVNGGVTLVMSTHMNRIIELNEANQTATVEPGLFGPTYEKALNNAPDQFGTKRCYTCGHFPQSFEYSTVGGWIVTLGAGQQSSYYGDIYDMVIGQEYVTPVGTFKTLNFPATATGPKVNDIMKGSEGAYGVLVGATLKIFQYMPENTKKFAFMFPSWKTAVNACREISQGEFGMPAVLRISDEEETDVALKLYGIDGTILDRIMVWRGLKPRERSLLIGRAEGEKMFAANIKRKVKHICRKYGAMYLTGYPITRWEHGRYTDPYMREDLNDYGIMLDTLESAVTWDNIHNLHKGVREFIKSRPNTICMTHASHFYPQGTNLYFIFIAKMDDIGEYKDFQKGIIDCIQNYGGSLSHHHGVGKMIAPWMEEHLGTEQMNVLRTLKKHFDPNNIMNPGGTLGLD
jgi:alkyldihydroxyacetonephosphate synthase